MALRTVSFAVCSSLWAAALSTFPRTNGCASYRCDSSSSSSSVLSIPPNAQLVFDVYINRSSYEDDIISPGCISQGISLLCAYPLQNDGTTWSGAVSIAGGVLAANYSDVGSGHCRTDSSGAPPSGMPAMNICGDAIYSDVNGVALVVDNQPSWTRSLFPEAFCPDLMPSVSVSQTGRLMMYLGSLGEIYGYYSDGVPVGSVMLWANASVQPGPQSSDWAPHDGVMVPISQQVVVGPRTLILTRYYQTGSYNPRPALTPTGELRLSATDLQDEDVPRIARPWVLPLSVPDDISGCVPHPIGIYAGIERLAIAGPIALTGNVVVLGVTCPGVSNASHIYGILVNSTGPSDPRPVPSVLWTLEVPLDAPSGNAPGSVTVRHMAVDASQAPENATAFWVSTGQRLVAVDSVSGGISSVVQLAAVVKNPARSAHDGSGCSAWANAVDVRAEGPMLTATPSDNSTAGATAMVLPVAVMLPSSGAASIALGGNSTVHGLLHLQLEAATGMTSVVWCAPTPGTVPGQYPVEGQVTLATNSSSTGARASNRRHNVGLKRDESIATWNVLSNGPSDDSSGTYLAFVTREGVFGLGAA